MTISAPRAVASSTSVRTRFFQWLRPLDLGGQQGIKSLDGLRAVAALMVVSYHIIGVITWSPALGGFNIRFIWQFLASGVLLFFVLSGFLLFLPYVRAMLDGRRLPAARRFYENRALRILPAFYVCLFILAAVHWQEYSPSQNFADIAVHVFFIHDISAQTVFAFDGPFWTLAAEWQFYLLLPLIAWGISRLVAKAAIPAALIGLGVCGFIGLALVYRAVAGLVVEHMGRIPAGLYWWVDRFLRITIGYQGKFLEVFGIGMLFAVIYVVVVERRRLPEHLLHWIGPGLVMSALISAYAIAQLQESGIVSAEYVYTDLRASRWETIAGSGLFGLSYGVLVLGVLLCGPFLRKPFEWTPIRYMGLWSFSLYLWHGPAVWGQLPGTAEWPLLARVVVGGALSFASYQLIERPVLRWRRSRSARKATARIQDVPTTISHVSGAVELT